MKQKQKLMESSESDKDAQKMNKFTFSYFSQFNNLKI